MHVLARVLARVLAHVLARVLASSNLLEATLGIAVATRAASETTTSVTRESHLYEGFRKK